MTVRWSEREPEAAAAPLSDVTRRLGPVSNLRLLHHLLEAPQVWLSLGVRESILAHVAAHRTEVGGLLLGHAYVASLTSRHGWSPVVIVDDVLASEQFTSSAVALAMGTEIWDRARGWTERTGRLVVGWYHSHPGLGAFFSGTDRRTQRAFFAHPYSLGLVVDPRRSEEAWFWGAASRPLAAAHVREVSTVVELPNLPAGGRI